MGSKHRHSRRLSKAGPSSSGSVSSTDSQQRRGSTDFDALLERFSNALSVVPTAARSLTLAQSELEPGPEHDIGRTFTHSSRASVPCARSTTNWMWRFGRCGNKPPRVSAKCRERPPTSGHLWRRSRRLLREEALTRFAIGETPPTTSNGDRAVTRPFQGMSPFEPANGPDRNRLNPLLERAITSGRITTWLDAQRQYAGIAQRPESPPVRYAVIGVAATAAAMARPTPRRAAAGPGTAAGAVAGPVAVPGRAGREQVRPCRTRLPRCSHSRQSAKPLRSEQRSNLTFVTSSCATHGSTGGGQPKNSTVCL